MIAKLPYYATVTFLLALGLPLTGCAEDQPEPVSSRSSNVEKGYERPDDEVRAERMEQEREFARYEEEQLAEQHRLADEERRARQTREVESDAPVDCGPGMYPCSAGCCVMSSPGGCDPFPFEDADNPCYAQE